MDQVRFGGSLVAPYETPGEPPQQTETVIAPEDRRFGGSLVAPYTGTVAAMEPETPAPAPEPVIVEDISDEPLDLLDTYVEKGRAALDEAIEAELEALMDVEDEHIPDEPKPFHGKGKKRR